MFLNTDKDIYITSDPHFFHDNLIKYCNRPCTPDTHIQWLIDTFNSQIPKDANVLCLGDIAFPLKKRLPELVNIVNQLNGKWHFLLGNHDNENHIRELCKQTNSGFLGDYKKFVYKERSIILFHFPIESWDGKKYGSLHLHGHTHNTNLPKIPNRFNMCLDLEFKVYKLDDLMDEKQI